MNDVIMQTFHRSKAINWQLVVPKVNLPFQQNYLESEPDHYRKHYPRSNATKSIRRVFISIFDEEGLLKHS